MIGDLSDRLPAGARCSKCAYLLRGLPEPVCPECGQRFDPSDSASFTLAPRWRRWIRPIAIALTVVGILFALRPRGLSKAELTVTCNTCGWQASVSRWELRPPSWIPFRYPGHTSATLGRADLLPDAYGRPGKDVVPPPVALPQECQHVYSAALKLPTRSLSAVASPGEVVTINGDFVTFASAETVLKAVMWPPGGTITITTAPEPEASSNSQQSSASGRDSGGP